jgi:hypothetical protein
LAAFSDPYAVSLGIALAVSAAAFSLWRAGLRFEFGNAVESGIVGNVFSAAAIAFTFACNAGQIRAGVEYARFWPALIVKLRWASLMVVLACSYAVGAVAWSLNRSGFAVGVPSCPSCTEKCGRLGAELQQMRQSLVSANADGWRAAGDRLKLVQAFDPVALRLAEWPFDRVSLLKYGLTPLGSLVLSHWKEIQKFLASH